MSPDAAGTNDAEAGIAAVTELLLRGAWRATISISPSFFHRHHFSFSLIRWPLNSGKLLIKALMRAKEKQAHVAFKVRLGRRLANDFGTEQINANPPTLRPSLAILVMVAHGATLSGPLRGHHNEEKEKEKEKKIEYLI